MSSVDPTGLCHSSEKLARVKREIVQASRILLKHGILDAFGHVSARHPADPNRFLLSRSLAPGLVTIDDIREFGLDGELISGAGDAVFLERYIHSAIYDARPDVHAVVHSHSPVVVALSVVLGMPLQSVCHTCGFLGKPAPLFEIRDVAGDGSDLLVRNRELGRALAACLADHSVVLMRGHGSTTVGGSVPEVTYRAIFTEKNANVQAMAARLGDIVFLTEREAAAVERTSAVQVERNWTFWLEELRPARSSE